MKKTFIYSAITLFAAALFFTGCKPSRVWANKEKEPRPTYQETRPAPVSYRYPRVALIIRPTPGFKMKQDNNGRFYHRSPQGFLYWKGYDNRFYLDRGHFSRISYDKYEYKDWKRYSRQSNNR